METTCLHVAAASLVIPSPLSRSWKRKSRCKKIRFSNADLDWGVGGGRDSEEGGNDLPRHKVDLDAECN